MAALGWGLGSAASCNVGLNSVLKPSARRSLNATTHRHQLNTATADKPRRKRKPKPEPAVKSVDSIPAPVGSSSLNPESSLDISSISGCNDSLTRDTWYRTNVAAIRPYIGNYWERDRGKFVACLMSTRMVVVGIPTGCEGEWMINKWIGEAGFEPRDIDLAGIDMSMADIRAHMVYMYRTRALDVIIQDPICLVVHSIVKPRHELLTDIIDKVKHMVVLVDDTFSPECNDLFRAYPSMKTFKLPALPSRCIYECLKKVAINEPKIANLNLPLFNMAECGGTSIESTVNMLEMRSIDRMDHKVDDWTKPNEIEQHNYDLFSVGKQSFMDYEKSNLLPGMDVGKVHDYMYANHTNAVHGIALSALWDRQNDCVKHNQKECPTRKFCAHCLEMVEVEAMSRSTSMICVAGHFTDYISSSSGLSGMAHEVGDILWRQGVKMELDQCLGTHSTPRKHMAYPDDLALNLRNYNEFKRNQHKLTKGYTPLYVWRDKDDEREWIVKMASDSEVLAWRQVIITNSSYVDAMAFARLAMGLNPKLSIATTNPRLPSVIALNQGDNGFPPGNVLARWADRLFTNMHFYQGPWWPLAFASLAASRNRWSVDDIRDALNEARHFTLPPGIIESPRPAEMYVINSDEFNITSRDAGLAVMRCQHNLDPSIVMRI